jgi:tryptophan-rich sensory protein
MVAVARIYPKRPDRTKRGRAFEKRSERKSEAVICMSTSNWYSHLIKPGWAPPEWLFGPVWAVLYTIIAVTFGTVFYRAFTGKVDWHVALPFALNLVFNFAFTPLQFGLKNNMLASIDVLLVVGTLVWALYAAWSASPDLHWIVYANIPYLLWGLFATALQLTITYLNR